MPPVTLTSDFGLADSYAGEMKGVILSGSDVPVIDITHELPRGDIWAGAWALRRIWMRFPVDTVHLCVVDPTVGSGRRAIAARAGERWFVGPDNGLLTFLDHEIIGIEAVRSVWRLRPPVGAPVSSTFHGRDLFAPAAAALARGRIDEALGEELAPASLARLAVPPAERGPEGLAGIIVHVDRFGNLVTDLPVEWLGEEPRVRVGTATVSGLADSYADVAPGTALLTRGSVGTLEVSVRDGRADRELQAERGDTVLVEAAPR